MERRDFLVSSIGFGTAVGLAVGPYGVRADHEDLGSVKFNEQATDGSSITIASISTDIDADLGVRGNDEDLYFEPITAGEYEDHEIELDQTLTESTELAVSLYDDDGHGFARDTAYVHVGEDIELIRGFETTLITADPDSGFNYPYFLYAPTRRQSADAGPILVEPTNTGTATDDFEQHKAAGRDIINSKFLRDIAEELNAPILVPVFPRPRNNPVDGTHYVHQLDDTTMEIEEGPLERVDLQLINMIEHAQQYLSEQDYPIIEDGVMLNGFSASGNFVDRFTVLHPNEVISVTAGGLNGMAILPLEKVDGRTLPYHVGIANAEELTGKSPDLDALSNTNQFLYMGAEDTNDTIPFDDAWTDDELRQLALDVYGEDMIADRFPRCQELYREAGVEAQFRIYPDTGHSPRPAKQDIIEFHRRSIAGEDVSHLGMNIVPEILFTQSPLVPAPNETVEFDASGSDPTFKEIQVMTWDFDDGETATGETVTHSFSAEGTYDVELSVIFTDGSSSSISHTAFVAEDGTIGESENPPGDVDRDGRYEDLTGDGTLDSADAETLIDNLDDPIVQNSPSRFDFDGDGEVTENDGQELYLKQYEEMGFNDVLQTISDFNSGGVPSFKTVLDAISRFNNRS